MKQINSREVGNRGIGSNALRTSILSGAVIGVLVVFVRVSLAALIFSGDLSVFLAAGIGIMLLSSLITGLVATCFSGFSVSVNGPQDIPSVLIGLIAATIVGSSALPLADNVFATIVMLMAVSSLITGALMWCFGHYNLGSFVRYIPYPVIGGFIAGTGWLLLTGGIGVINNAGLNLQMLAPESVIYWLPAVVFALTLLVATSRSDNPMLLPVIVAISLALFYVAAALIGGNLTTGLSMALSNGWLMGPLPDGDLWRPVIFTTIQNAQWNIVFDNTVSLLTISLITTIAFLLNCSGLEVVTRSDIDLNRELKLVGYSNFLSSAIGSTPVYHFLSLSALTHRLGATSRVSGIMFALIIVITLVAGTQLLNYAPKFVIAGFLIYLGLSFLTEWLYESWFNLPKTDYFLIWLILIVIATIGLLQGVLTGLVVAVILFVMAYTNTDVVRRTFTRDKFQSNTMRAPLLERMLEDNGEKCYVIELQGFVFFGMAHKLLDRVKARITDPSQVTLNFLLLDFRLVTGIDSSASYSFSRLQQIAEQNNVVLAFSNLSPAINSYLNGMESGKLEVYKDIDHAIASFDETEIKLQIDAGNNIEPVQLIEYFQSVLQDDQSLTVLERIRHFMQLESAEPGTVLLNEGEPVEQLYFIESGEVCAQTVLDDGSIKTLRVQGAGTVVGEIGIYTGASATADVIVTKEAKIFRVSSRNIKRMELEDPDLAVAVHRLIAITLGRKLTHSSNAMLALQK